MIVFRSPKDLADAAADEFFGYTHTISKEVRLLLSLQKHDLLRQLKRSQSLLDGNKRAQDQLLNQKVGEITQRGKRNEEGVRSGFGDGMKGLKGRVRDAKAAAETLRGRLGAVEGLEDWARECSQELGP